MDDGPYWVILLMYGSHDMRHIGFRRLTLVNETPGFWGVTHLILINDGHILIDLISECLIDSYLLYYIF